MDDRAKVDCVANARALAPVIAAATPRIEADRELPADLVDALHEARLWRMLLPRSYGGDEVSPVAAPGRLKDFAGLAPAYLDVGDLDIFRDETIAYAAGLARAGVQVELHVHPTVPHGWERVAPDSASARRAYADRLRVIGAL